jgi:hypothetical protein
MKAPRTILPISLAAALSACIVVPTIDKNAAQQTNCQTFTKRMTLQSVNLGSASCGGSNAGECLAAYLAVGAGSAIVSGSIVLTGNTIHWLEYQGRCGDGYLHIAKQQFLDSLGRPEHTVTNTPQQ